MMYTKPLTKLSNKNIAAAGGKGASLGELLRAGIPVPNGFVILTDSFDKFIDDTDLRQEIRAQLNKADQNKMHTVERASERIQSMILRAEMPKEIAEAISKDFSALDTKYVAVRSSATAEDSDSAAWAGQLETYLNTTEETLLENVQKCWASLFTPRAIFYRFEQGLKESNVSVAVVVQEMIESEKAGIAFSVHPVTQDKNQIIIEAGFGLGEAVVSGAITPDSYVVSKKDDKIIDINIHEQTKALYKKDGGGNEWKNLDIKGAEQVLSEKDVLKLAEIIKKIESHYKTPQDIEWAFANGEFYITQSRPITTLSTTHITSSNTKLKILTNVFSREKNLFYLCVWNESDRIGANMFGEELQNNLFVVQPKGKKGGVWYDATELEHLKQKAIKVLNSEQGTDLMKVLQKRNTDSWNFMIPFIKEKKHIQNFDELKEYYQALISFWTTMNSFIWEAQEDVKMNNTFKKIFLAWRTETEQYSERANSVITEYVEQTYPEIADIAWFITFDELEQLVVNNVSNVSKDKLGARLSGCFMLNGTVYSINKLEEILSSSSLEMEKIATDVSELTGTAGYTGIVEGKVFIVEGFDDLKKVKTGDVLVTQMTNPEYLPAIKKASAIVTDEGGMLCHAAITSRELKKPCIIGTKVATKALRNNDIVEVDGDNGIVKIIKRSGE